MDSLVNGTETFHHNNNNLWIVMELMSAGTSTDLFDTIEIEDKLISYICRDILTGLSASHDLNRVHRDRKVTILC